MTEQYTYTPAQVKQSDKKFTYLTYSQKLADITGSPWDRCSGSSLADVKKQVGDDLVHDPGAPEMIFIKSEVVAAELRAELMDQQLEDLVVTLVCNVTHRDSAQNVLAPLRDTVENIPAEQESTTGPLWIESVPYSQLKGRITELRHECDGELKVLMAYSAETKELIMWNDLDVGEIPRMPGYSNKKMSFQKKIYRTLSDGVIR